MNYELAKRLKDAGFVPEGIPGPKTYLVGDDVYVPTLEELIAECGKRFGSLEQYTNPNTNGLEWKSEAKTNPNNGELSAISVGHASPLEAVANLWLSLHEFI